jgi:hypothetical protein
LAERNVYNSGWEGAKEEVTLELVIPPEQRWMEGAWFDYIDFFDD